MMKECGRMVYSSWGRAGPVPGVTPGPAAPQPLPQVLPSALPAQLCPPAAAGTHPCPPPPSCCRLQRWHHIKGAARDSCTLPHPGPASPAPPGGASALGHSPEVGTHVPITPGPVERGPEESTTPPTPGQLTALHRGLVALHELPLHELVGQGGFAWEGSGKHRAGGRGGSIAPGRGQSPTEGREPARCPRVHRPRGDVGSQGDGRSRVDGGSRGACSG